jgi:peptidoglycan/LPS O-acetylase OafA/YrhL
MSSTAPIGRLAYLDGLRGIAILAVLGFHYFTCFQDWVPYGGLWADVPLFRWGHWGVQLFFAVSGFVIVMTLERCRSPAEFAVRRLARLWPTLALCAALSYLVLTVLPSPWKPGPMDFLPSLTFIDGALWNKLVPGLETRWIDVAYWSLFVEVRFYAWAALLWFVSPRHFTRSFYAFSTAAVALYVLLHWLGHASLAEWLQWALAAKFLPWFVLGVAARAAARGDRRGTAIGLSLAAVQTALLLFRQDPHAQPAALALVAALMLAPLRWPTVARCMGIRPLVAVGVASYSLYLLHQYAGLAFIGTLARTLELQGAASLPLALGVAGLMLGLARLIHCYWEGPLNDRWVRFFLAWQGRRTVPRALQAHPKAR